MKARLNQTQNTFNTPVFSKQILPHQKTSYTKYQQPLYSTNAWSDYNEHFVNRWNTQEDVNMTEEDLDRASASTASNEPEV